MSWLESPIHRRRVKPTFPTGAVQAKYILINGHRQQKEVTVRPSSAKWSL